MHQRLMNRLANPASGPDCSVPATGWAGTKRAWAGSVGFERRDDGALDRTHVRDDRAWLKRRCDGASDRLVRADGRAENDAIGASNRASRIVGDDVAKRERLRALQHPDRMVGKDDTPRGMAPARGARDRRADQPDADDRQLFENRLGERLPEPVNHLCLA